MSSEVVPYYKNKSLESLEGEIWRDVKGFEGLYQVSNLGRIKSLDKFTLCGRDFKTNAPSIKKRKAKISAQWIDKYGYLKCTLQNNGVIKYTTVHRVVAIAFIDNPLSKPTINHKDGNKLNNTVENLEWATNKEQTDHAIAIGIHTQEGKYNNGCKLTEEQVLEIKRRALNLKFGDKAKWAKEFNVNPLTIGNIVRNITWTKLKI